jgi:fatty-acid desaturase
MTTGLIHRRIRYSGMLIVTGLLIQAFTLLWTHPLAFVCFLMVGCPLTGAGILLFLHSLVSHETA